MPERVDRQTADRRKQFRAAIEKNLQYYRKLGLSTVADVTHSFQTDQAGNILPEHSAIRLATNVFPKCLDVSLEPFPRDLNTREYRQDLHRGSRIVRGVQYEDKMPTPTNIEQLEENMRQLQARFDHRKLEEASSRYLRDRTVLLGARLFVALTKRVHADFTNPQLAK